MTDWRDEAACRDVPEGMTRAQWVKVFVRNKLPEPRTYTQSYARARAVCERCPVLDDCREYALSEGELYGMWGGLSPNERKDLRREMRGGRMPHGYSHGCRCQSCRENEMARHERRRGGGLCVNDDRHGTENGYVNFGCRCLACVGAARYARSQRRREAS